MDIVGKVPRRPFGIQGWRTASRITDVSMFRRGRPRSSLATAHARTLMAFAAGESEVPVYQWLTLNAAEISRLMHFLNMVTPTLPQLISF